MKPIPDPDDMHSDVPIADLPFYKWLDAQENPSDRWPHVLYDYFETDNLRGKFDNDEQVRIYKNIHRHFWWLRHHNLPA